MTPVAAFAPDTSPLPGARADFAAAPHGWLQELQKRAQAESWFPAPLEPTSPQAAAVSLTRPVEGPSGVLPRGLRPGSTEGDRQPAAMRPCSVAGDAYPAAQPVRNEDRAARVAVTDSVPPSVSPSHTSESRAAASAITRRTAPIAQRAWTHAPDTSGVRVHVQQDDAGLHVWLGIGRRDALHPSQAEWVLATVLAGATSPTHRLASLVCNGTTVYADSRAIPSLPSQEQPWPSAH